MKYQSFRFGSEKPLNKNRRVILELTTHSRQIELRLTSHLTSFDFASHLVFMFAQQTLDPHPDFFLDPEGNTFAHLLPSITLSAPLFHKTIISLPQT
ncbi:hypothetical protein M422DRAFT_241306 [Sphaerobolus stellatus SS14]|nr:hypothetical protein M422DRAFT_241306 [Sphaerobolus stellatus SS14]